MSSLVPIERGISWSLTDCFEGNEKKDRKPIKELINLVSEYPGLKEIALGIEGLICRRGQHASGVMMYNVSPFETTALMRSPNGDITTQFDLHASETLGDTKFDYLVTDICDKLSVCLELLKKNGYFSECSTLREIYDKYLHPQVIDLKNPKIWRALKDGSVQDVFQFNTALGIQTAQAIQPQNPTEMTAANALLRLVAPEGEERPFDRYIRFKNDISLWYKEMDMFGLTKEEQKNLEPYYLKDYGVPCNQEVLMAMVMDPKISHFTLAEANQCRRVLAKKKIKEIPIIKEKFLNQCPSKTLGEYCWKTMMLPQMSYSFSMVHSTLYTFIGIQTLVIATLFPIIYWNCACLIVNSQSIEEDLLDEEETPIIPDSDETDNAEDDEETADEETENPKKKKVKNTDYGRVATAIGKMNSLGISVAPPSINTSSFTFIPDESKNEIRYGLRGITKVGEEVVQQIIANRPYTSISDFLSKIKVSKPQMVNLIKCGAFDDFGDRTQLMHEYVNLVSDTKKRITLQNMKMLIDFGLIPEEFDLQRRVFNFNKYLKKMKTGDCYGLDNIALDFLDQRFSIDNLIPTNATESGFKILQKDWDKIYKNQMDIIRPFVKEHANELLEKVNYQLTKDLWEKYCLGSVSKWEMDSVSYYSHPHELQGIDLRRYGVVNYFDLPEQPQPLYYLNIKGKQIPIYEIVRIAGTVLDKDKTKKTVTLLTTEGVVTVKIYGAFPNYDKQISEIGADGKKHVIRKSEFTRGNKIIVTGIKRDQMFFAKKYKSTSYHLVDTIEEIHKDGTIKIFNRSDDLI